MLEPRQTFSRRNPQKVRRASKLTIPERVGPHVRLVFSEMKRQGVRYDDVEEKAGLLRSTLKAWRHRNAPSLTGLEAVFGFLGWDFVPIPREHALPPEVVDELRPIATKLGLTMPETIRELAAIAAGLRPNISAQAA